jgi:hypothetical protein
MIWALHCLTLTLGHGKLVGPLSHSYRISLSLTCPQPSRRRTVFVEEHKMSQDQAEQNIQMWKVKKLIKSLDSARGCVAPPLTPYCPGLQRFGINLQCGHFHDQFDYTSQSKTPLWPSITCFIYTLLCRIKFRGPPPCLPRSTAQPRISNLV